MGNREIDERWAIFAYHLLKGVNATEAYLRAGYANTTRASAQAAASRLRRRPRFRAFFEPIRQRLAAESRRRTVENLHRKLTHLSQIIRTPAGRVPRRRRHLIVSRQTHQNGGCVVRLPDKLTALELHSKLAGHLDLAPDPFVPEPNDSPEIHIKP